MIWFAVRRSEGTFAQFLKGCKLCMLKVTTLEHVRDSLRDLKHPVEVPEPIRVKAELALGRMFEVEGR